MVVSSTSQKKLYYLRRVRKVTVVAIQGKRTPSRELTSGAGPEALKAYLEVHLC